MRNLLAGAVALAPLLAATGAQADVVISTTRTTPVVTSTAGTGGTPDTVTITSGGSVTVNTGTAVTIDSSHNVGINAGGGITMANATDNATAILINGGNTANLSFSGTIGVTDNIDTYPDTDSDGDLDGPFANGTGRYGVRLVGASPLTGNIRLEIGSNVLVEGNNSFGMSLESGLIGNLTNLGTIRVVGTGSTAVAVQGDITGNVYLGGSVSVAGQNASGVVFNGDVSGRLDIQGSVSATGYRYTTRGTDAFIGALDSDDLLQGGSAVVVAGNVGSGLVFGRPQTNINDSTADDDGDGVPDTDEATAQINSYGAAPAVVVGSATQAVTLGLAGTGDNAFGFINRGSITGQGVYDGVAANAIQLGVAGGQTLTIEGGIRNDGTISALAFDATSRGIVLGAGVSTPQFITTGAITAAAATETATEVTALRIESGASLPTFSNSGQFLASAGGGTANVTGILDLSGTLTSITNTRSMQANLSQNDAGDAITGSTTIIDVRANTTGVSILQTGTPNTATTADPDTDGDGVSDSNEPIMTGDILLGTGADTVSFQNGLYAGDISFGAGLDNLLVGGGARVTGALSDSDGLLNVNIANGILDARHSSPLTISNLDIGASGDLIVTLNPNAGTNSGFIVTGTANLANGAGLGVRFDSLINSPQRFNIIQAGTLNVGTLDSAAIQANSSYLFVVNAGTNVGAGQVYIDARRRTADEAGLSRIEASAYDAFYAALDRDDSVLAAFVNQTGRDGFLSLYEQTLPDHSGGPLLSLASGVDAVTRALTGRNASAAPGETSAWLQEINFYADKDKTDTYGFRSEGFGVAGGVERGSDLGAVGLSFAFTSSDLEDPEAEAEEVLSANLIELGLYWRAQGQYWTTWARAAAGYATFEATRQIVGSGLNLSNESSWNGYTLSASGGVSYERQYGIFGLRPEAYVEYFSLHEDARTEDGAGDSFDLSIDERDGHMFSAVAAMNISMNMGERSWLKPELRFGWRQNVSVDPGETIARYVSGGPDFRLSPDSIEGGGPIAGLRLNIGNELGMLTVSADAEMIEDYIRYMLFLRASFRF
ncbi:autotransporter outer membrane beta-barrel domain-containing protein [Rhizobium sp. CRIBSB]|nr:autotransporter outer membrane beta-barrel domain-containing protein [Rhizobium sp. CRIBSB]